MQTLRNSSKVLPADVHEASEVLFAAPPRTVIESALTAAAADTPSTPWRLLLDADTADALSDDFVAATSLADLLAAEAFQVRVSEKPVAGRFVVGDAVHAFVSGEDGPLTVSASDDATVNALERWATDAWAAAEEFDPDAPPRSELVDAAAALDQTFGGELETALAAADALSWREPTDAVALCVAVAARCDVQLFELGNWGEEVGVASRSSFVRTKQRFVDSGLVDVERISRGVGRPRQLLVVGDERLATPNAAALVGELRELIS